MIWLHYDEVRGLSRARLLQTGLAQQRQGVRTRGGKLQVAERADIEAGTTIPMLRWQRYGQGPVSVSGIRPLRVDGERHRDPPTERSNAPLVLQELSMILAWPPG